MKRNLLLTLGLLLGSVTAMNAQVLQEGFNGEQTKSPTDVGWYEFINNQEGDTREITTTTVNSGEGAMHFYNTLVDTTNWRRAIKFRNLPLKENTSYRVSFYLCGDNTYTIDGTEEIKSKARVALMQGQEDGDMPLLAVDSTQFVYDISYFQTPETGYQKYTMMFYYANQAVQQEYYKDHPGELTDLAEKFFLAMNVYSPGDYYIDDVSVSESEIAGVTFNADVIRINFGYTVNVKDLVAATGKTRLVLPNDCVKVKMNGEEINVLTVEARPDGYVYIFLDDTYPESAEDKVEVSFTNPTDEAMQVMYTDNLRPRSWDENDTKAVGNFADEIGTMDESIVDIYSSAYDTPLVDTALPEDGSFDLPLDTKEFRVLFDKPVDCAKAEASLKDINGTGEALTVTPNKGFSTELILTRGGADLAAGEYTMNVTKIYPERSLGDEYFGDYNITLNFGSGSSDPNDTARVVLVDSFAVKGANYIPEGWTLYSGGSEKPCGAAGSGPRVFNFTAAGGSFTYGMYVRTENANEGDGYVEYGLTDNYLLTLEAGSKYQLKYTLAAWKGTPFMKCEIIGPNDEVVISQIDACAPNLNGSTTASTVGATSVKLDFKATASGNYKVKWTPVADAEGTLGSWLETVLANVQMQYVPATAGVIYKNMLASALEEAIKCRDGNTDERYAGPAIETLKAKIAEYEGKSFTAPSVYVAASEELNAATATMTNHRTLCDTYDPMPAAGQTVVDQFAGTKFEAADYFVALKAAVATYTGKVLTDDDELTTAIKALGDATTTCTNMCTTGATKVTVTGVAALTARIASGVATAKQLGVAADDAAIVAAEKALTDDDAVANNLKGAVRNQIYTILSDPSNKLFETKVDPVTLEEYTDSFDMNVFVKNPNAYVTTTTTTDLTTETTNGWTVKLGEGWAGGFAWSTGWSWLVTDNCPVADGIITNYNVAFDAYQEITDLPAGVYSVILAFGERETFKTDGTQTDTVSYAYIKTSDMEKEDTVYANHIGQTFPVVSTAGQGLLFQNVTVTDGKLLLGVHGGQHTHNFFNEAAIYLKAAAKDFNYVTGIYDMTNSLPGGELLKTEYFDMNGRSVNNSNSGLIIKKQTYKNGSVKVEKTLNK